MLRRRCSVCTNAISLTDRLAFLGDATLSFYLEPPIHLACAAYALQVCPKLHGAGARIEVALTRTYTLRETRLTGVNAVLKPTRALFDYQDPAARGHLLEFYVAYPEAPQRVPAPEWLARDVEQR
ncbi:hypothetical protein OG689_44595 [Kitasatospora sp. NBC_00240]|uniref:hypothetical protein n=1 Tax=Kitasatospora sp. NBC_00240 TaxID=2903567 RepID=UPI0022535559|nr:hypothetical protein [Kitasatospora sp. NBC_00240]MCX5216219.1 hypothetical protein [Kitasatospora sp. NBC_00240]